MNGVDAVEQVFAKHALLHHFRYIFVRCRNQADIDRNHFVTAQTSHIPALQYGEELGLEWEREVAQFVHEQ